MEGRLCSYVGRWWGAGHDCLPTDIDVVGLDDSGKKAVIGECKFKNEIPDKGVYDDLMNKKGLIGAHYTEVQFLLFSLSGFSKWLLDNADKASTRLITLDDLYKG